MNTRRVNQASFTTTNSTDKQAKSILWLRQKINQDKLAALYRHLNVTGDLDVVE